MSLKEEIEKRHAAEEYVPCHEAGSNPRTLTLEWRTGKRRTLPWARLIDATLEDGELLLSFTGREVTFYGLILGGLLDAVVEYRLEKVWELPADYRPSADLKRPCVSKIEVSESEC
ncbi:hypothetical protein DF3PB_470003 [uncultured Defluviicoccus sp.]|uniref:Uncharacterized protein n=1 Tax=metagenome TaxID=256318 RepID=A0A380TGJ5_9ZZZZ|nr:hypothetical protein DF3PB_470003 [uncultured Defluviicoccus sp.]